MLEHGGNLNDAARHYGRPRSEWLDLSTGINPLPYPAPAPAPDAWHRLPEPSDDLARAACAYYGAARMLPVAGTQAAIQALPQLRLRRDGRAARVVVAAPIYAEHAHCWTRAGHAVREVPYEALDAAVQGDCEVLVLCNPNNPTGAMVAPEQLLRWARQLGARGGWLVVDEAFGDTVREYSVAAHAGDAGADGLIVLRSVGKFFGLAGLRLGFVAAGPTLLDELADWLGPWTVSGPAQQVGIAALRDEPWQRATLQRLLADGERLRALLARQGMTTSGSALFQWWPEPRAQAFHAAMARQGVWVRLFTCGAGGIRIGLPPDEDGWRRLALALQAWSAHG